MPTQQPPRPRIRTNPGMPPRIDPDSQSPLLDNDETAKAYSSIDQQNVASPSGWNPTQKRMHRIGTRWKRCFLPLLLIITLLLPVLIFRHSYLSFLAHSWFAPLMGMIACAIPSGGAPVAGGVVFLPVLSLMGMEPHDGVAFAAATQMFGVGIFAPLGWMARDPTVLMPRFLLVTLPYALAGLLTGLLLIPLGKSDEVMWAFTVFIAFLAWYTVHGLISNLFDVSGGASGAESDDDDDDIEMHTHKNHPGNNLASESDAMSIQKNRRESKTERRKIQFSRKEYAIYAMACYLGGVLTSWVGVGVEKITFVLLTYFHDVDVTAAGVSSIFLTGILSSVAFLFHALCAPAGDGPGPHFQCALKSATDPTGSVFGNVPYEILLAVLPGILLGSLIGPQVNASVGPRNMMLIFVAFLLFDIGYNLVDLLG